MKFFVIRGGSKRFVPLQPATAAGEVSSCRPGNQTINAVEIMQERSIDHEERRDHEREKLTTEMRTDRE